MNEALSLKENESHSAWMFRLQWAFANAMPLVIVSTLAWFFEQFTSHAAIGALLYFALFSSIAIAQWLVLQRWVKWSAKWAAATLSGIILGWAVATPLMAMLDPAGFEALAIIVAHACGGAITGAAQWLVLRKRVLHAAWWVIINAALWSVLAILLVPFWNHPWIPGYVVGPYSGSIELTTLLRASAASGLVTGHVLIWLLRHRCGDKNEN